MTYATKVILPQSHWEMYWLAFLCKRGAVFLTQTFPFCPYSIAILGIFWLSRQNWSIGCFRTIIGEHFCLPIQKNPFLFLIWVVFLVILPSLARRTYCMLIFSSKLPILVASLLIQHILVHFQYILALIPILQHLFSSISQLALKELQIVSQKQLQRLILLTSNYILRFSCTFQ